MDMDEMAIADALPFTQPLPIIPTAPESIPESASELLLEDLTEKIEQLRTANEKARVATEKADRFKFRCDALSSQLVQSNKRAREAIEHPKVAELAGTPDNPKKRPSPEVARTPKPGAGIDPLAGMSDDEVPPPIVTPSIEPPSKEACRKFTELNSVLCGYKDKQIVPGSTDLPFEICADLCRDEAGMMLSLSSFQLSNLRPAIVSALQLVYPNKKPAWFDSQFLRDPKGAAKYWSRVLIRRSEIWDAAASRVVARCKTSHTAALRDRIRLKIQARKAERLSQLRAPSVLASKSRSAPRNKLSLALSSSDDEGPINTIDLSQSPSGMPVDGKSPVTPVKTPKAIPPKMAAGPDTYTMAEMKSFVRMVKSIRNVDEKSGHAEATATFVDTEFSDNCGRVLQALKAKDQWKRHRVNSICAKAAKIMEDR